MRSTPLGLAGPGLAILFATCFEIPIMATQLHKIAKPKLATDFRQTSYECSISTGYYRITWTLANEPGKLKLAFVDEVTGYLRLQDVKILC